MLATPLRGLLCAIVHRNLMKYGTLLGVKKQTLGHQSPWPLPPENRGLGARWSWYCKAQTTLQQSEALQKLHILHRRLEYIYKHLPKNRHIIGKIYTVGIERNNSNTRHHLARFTRRTKLVSKKGEMVDLSLKLWQAFTLPETFEHFQSVALAIFKW